MNELYMHRCFDLARLGAGHVSPNPMVGAVLVHENRIIGEGWHRQYGKAHAEVNAVASVKPEDQHLIEKTTLYVSLEPCCIFGKTPPCTNLILEKKIPRVVISCLDQTPEVRGKGVDILRQNGVEVVTGILAKEGEVLSGIRNTFVARHRPYINLKFAQSSDGFMGKPGQQVWISNPFSKRLAHKWRSEFDAILIGTKTALMDNPQLNNRLWFGKSPLRILLDKKLAVPKSAHIYDATAKTLVVTEKVGYPVNENVEFLSLPFDENLLEKLLKYLFEKRITSLIVEGGSVTLSRFIEQGLWDEATVFTSKTHLLNGIKAPVIPVDPFQTFPLGTDTLTLYRNGPPRR
ncbi:MAG: bifunctional diaminohydroxyphosphoribosylaminopyrimidine deaminase/5-amino-6-(5-phosphoribosylamino)uracil reductase RibD [Saprospiraceae bacterium]|nr:bifunctional diaminohydroxyphosphoribosylaminopyrimidine deaminase/5-amino-6-(5-phosphoribosylamino)uracil reductase RibD [Saprospiraceae bacterium]